MYRFLLYLLNKLRPSENFSKIKSNAPIATDGSCFIDVKDQMANLTDQQLITSANNYWDAIGIPSASRKIKFNNSNDNINELIKKGFSIPESWGIWSDGPISEIEIPLETGELKGVTLYFKMRAFITDGKDKFTVKMKIKGREISKKEISTPFDFLWIVNLDGQYLADQKSLSITFEFDNLKSPFELALSEDRRLISIGLLDLQLVRALTAAELQSWKEKLLDTATVTYTDRFRQFFSPNA
jgi:hypothetical protein